MGGETVFYKLNVLLALTNVYTLINTPLPFRLPYLEYIPPEKGIFSHGKTSGAIGRPPLLLKPRSVFAENTKANVCKTGCGFCSGH